MLLAAAARSSPGGQRIIASLTIETISRGTKEMTRLTLTVQGCYWLSKIRMTVVELWWKSAGAGKHFGKKSGNNKAKHRRKKIGPPGENTELLILKEEN
jgi:hypothetical protein